MYRMEFIASIVHRIKCEYSHDMTLVELNIWTATVFLYIKFTLLLQKVVSPYEYMDDWKKISEHCYLKI